MSKIKKGSQITQTTHPSMIKIAHRIFIDELSAKFMLLKCHLKGIPNHNCNVRNVNYVHSCQVAT